MSVQPNLYWNMDFLEEWMKQNNRKKGQMVAGD